MSSFRQFRIDRDENGNVDFLFKLNNDDGQILCNLWVAGNGIYHYPKNSQIFSTVDAEFKYISMENIHELFDKIKKCEWFGDGTDLNLSISVEKNKIIIQESTD